MSAVPDTGLVASPILAAPALAPGPAGGPACVDDDAQDERVEVIGARLSMKSGSRIVFSVDAGVHKGGDEFVGTSRE
jgi:hypothetical protein